MGCSVSTAHDRVQRAIAAVPVEAVNQIRAVELDRLDDAFRGAYRLMHTDQVKVDHGKVVRDDVTGEPIIDHTLKLSALRSLLRIAEGRRRLIPHLEAPKTATLTVMTEDVVDAQIRELEAELARSDRGQRPAGETPALEGTSGATG